MSNQELVPSSQPKLTVENMVAAWLHEKFNRSGSVRTHKVYEDTITSFRSFLRQHGAIDLDGEPQEIANFLQVWSASVLNPALRSKVSAATKNNRIAIVSSFYKYAIRRGHLTANPTVMVLRSPVNHPHKAHPLAHQDVERGLAQIDRSTPLGARDYALLMVAFNTGLRVSTLAGLALENLSLKNGVVTITTQTKGGKDFRRELTADQTRILSEYLLRIYYPVASTLSALIVRRPGAPLWVSFGVNTFMKPLGTAGLRAALRRYFGTTKFHTARHTFAKALHDSGASLSEIQALLGHSDIAVTAKYMERQSGDVNPYAGKLDVMFGITSGDEDTNA